MVSWSFDFHQVSSFNSVPRRMTLDTTAPPALLNSAWKQVEALPDDYDPEEWEEEEVS